MTMSEKANYITLIKYALRHPNSTYNYLQEYMKYKENYRHPFVYNNKVKAFENYVDFLKALFNLQEIDTNSLSGLSTLYENSINKVKNLYGEDKSLSVTSLDESLVLYFSIRYLQPKIVVETGVSDGMSSLFILSALEKMEGHLYSIDYPKVGMPALYGKEPGWLVNDQLRARWTLIYGKSKEKLPILLSQLKHVDIFLHDSEHSYSNMKFEFTLALEHMSPGSLLLSDDVSSNSAFYEAVAGHGLYDNIYWLKGEGSDFGAYFYKP